MAEKIRRELGIDEIRNLSLINFRTWQSAGLFLRLCFSKPSIIIGVILVEHNTRIEHEVPMFFG